MTKARKQKGETYMRFIARKRKYQKEENESVEKE